MVAGVIFFSFDSEMKKKRLYSLDLVGRKFVPAALRLELSVIVIAEVPGPCMQTVVVQTTEWTVPRLLMIPMHFLVDTGKTIKYERKVDQTHKWDVGDTLQYAYPAHIVELFPDQDPVVPVEVLQLLPHGHYVIRITGRDKTHWATGYAACTDKDLSE
jgi:hypothetical protein